VDQDDFEQFYNASYQRLLWELFAVTGGDLPEAEDALQEAYVRASLRWPCYGWRPRRRRGPSCRQNRSTWPPRCGPCRWASGRSSCSTISSGSRSTRSPGNSAAERDRQVPPHPRSQELGSPARAGDRTGGADRWMTCDPGWSGSSVRGPPPRTRRRCRRSGAVPAVTGAGRSPGRCWPPWSCPAWSWGPARAWPAGSGAPTRPSR
jgi:hypothetical protein